MNADYLDFEILKSAFICMNPRPITFFDKLAPNLEYTPLDRELGKFSLSAGVFI